MQWLLVFVRGSMCKHKTVSKALWVHFVATSDAHEWCSFARCFAADVHVFVWQGITGAFRPGVLTALMGASGAGKTTLMDVLADRKTGSPPALVKLCNFDVVTLLLPWQPC